MGVVSNRPAYEDRRRWARYPLNASIRVITGTAIIAARGIRMSESGICLFAVADLPIGTQIKVEFTSPRSGEPIGVYGTVCNRAVYLYGVKFRAENLEDQRRVAHLGDAFRRHSGR